jgi:hypothetical protein
MPRQFQWRRAECHAEADATANRLARGLAVSLSQVMAKASSIGPPPGEHKPGDHTPVEHTRGEHTPDKVARQEARPRADRLAAALKSNLHRRRVQARERAADAGEAGHPAGPAGDQSASPVLSPPADESPPRQEASDESAENTGHKLGA